MLTSIKILKVSPVLNILIKLCNTIICILWSTVLFYYLAYIINKTFYRLRFFITVNIPTKLFSECVKESTYLCSFILIYYNFCVLFVFRCLIRINIII
uniref:Uncharacterized protein n=1 Tax=Dulem virus 42 TaxID=3145760 RepID=A0AAU8BB30_9CAUD